MRTRHQILGNAVCEWDDSAPLIWTMTEIKGKGDNRRTETQSFDLTPLTQGYELGFLLHLKDALISRRNRIALSTLAAEYSHIRSVLCAMQARDLLDSIVTQIDQVFLLSLRTILDDIHEASLYCFRRLFATHRESPMYAPDLMLADFPVKRPKRGITGDVTSRIVTKALTRAACVEILRVFEDAYEADKIDIGLFSFLNLAFHIYCRPSSYQQLTAADLQIDIHPDSKIATHFLWITHAKTRVNAPSKICYQLNHIMGELLEAQRIHIIKIHGHRVGEGQIGNLALFPARALDQHGNWVSAHARAHCGAAEYQTFHSSYLKPIQNLLPTLKFDFNALRHTIGTHLAVAGCSAHTIQAVLKHAGYQTCQIYVDIAFHGLIDRLSDTLKPAFEAHFPVFKAFRSKNDPVDPQKAIHSEDLETGRMEFTGECGRSVACQYAPLACYPCPRFIPCYDADHGINLTAVDAEIVRYKAAGLPFRHLLDRAKDARRNIILVMAATEQKRHALKG